MWVGRYVDREVSLDVRGGKLIEFMFHSLLDSERRMRQDNLLGLRGADRDWAVKI